MSFPITQCSVIQTNQQAQNIAFQDMQKAKEELEKKKRKVNSTDDKAMKQEACDQNAPVIKCQVG